MEVGLTRKDAVRTQIVPIKLGAKELSTKTRESHLRWYGYEERREVRYVGRKILEKGFQKREESRGPTRRLMDNIKGGMRDMGLDEEAETREIWKWTQSIRCGDPA